MLSHPLVSIITPSFNSSALIEETINSVLSQSFQNWEMIIIDDSSTDNTNEIIEKFVKRDKRIIHLSTTYPSGSPSLPRNLGIEKARGKYIAFLDADDIWLPEKLKVQIDYMEKNHINFTYTDYEKINFDGYRNNRVIKMPKCSSFWDVIETCTIPCLTVVLTKEIIGTTRFKNIAKEDFAFWLDILKKDVKAYNFGGVLALYREQRKSRSSNKWNMIKSQWNLLRQVEGVKPFVASYFMLKYLFYGIIKYMK